MQVLSSSFRGALMAQPSPDHMIPEMNPDYLSGTLGITEEDLKGLGTALALDRASAGRVFETLKPFSLSDREVITSQFIVSGGDPAVVNKALADLRDREEIPSQIDRRRNLKIAYSVLATLSAGASAYHGYRRNQSLGWAIWWAFWGGIFPVFTPAIGLAQGFGQPK